MNRNMLSAVVVIGLVVLGCAGYGTFNSHSVAKDGLSKKSVSHSQYNVEGLLAEDFPRKRVHLTFALVFEDRFEGFYKEGPTLANEKIRHSILLYLADRNVADFHGSEKLQKVLSEIRDRLNREFWPDKNGKIQRVLLQGLSFREVSQTPGK